MEEKTKKRVLTIISVFSLLFGFGLILTGFGEGLSNQDALTGEMVIGCLFVAIGIVTLGVCTYWLKVEK